MCLGKEKYRGFIIYHNEHGDFKTEYYSVFNPRNNCHVHINKSKAARKIVDCFYAKNSSKYGRLIRNRALELQGYKVRF